MVLELDWPSAVRAFNALTFLEVKATNGKMIGFNADYQHVSLDPSV